MSPLVSDHYTYANIVLLLGDRSSITSDESAKEVQTAVEGAFGGVRCLIECSVDVLYLTISLCVVLCCVCRKEQRFIRPTTQWQPRPALHQLCLSIRYARLSPVSVFTSHVCCLSLCRRRWQPKLSRPHVVRLVTTLARKISSVCAVSLNALLRLLCIANNYSTYWIVY